jgi:HAE1 family hydrophobic/amphiphilic exporter-1
MFTVPLGVIGVAFGLGVMGLSISMPALLGACILVGIVVNNAIVMIDCMNRLRRQGVPFHEAIIEGATTRLRPILVTSLTTILGILPMGLSRSQGAELRAPIGISVASGLAFGMLLTLFVIPAAYSLLARRSVARAA